MSGHEVIISSCGLKLWVNSKKDGSCIARFDKRFGMDIHRTGTEMMEGKGECLYCSHEKPTSADWETFRKKVFEAYDVEIDVSSLAF